MIDQILSPWKEALDNAELDEAVSIRIAPLTQNGLFDIFVTSLPPGHKISAHVHSEGSEFYFILEGSGTIRLATFSQGESKNPYEIQLEKGQMLALPPNMIHQLKNTDSEKELVLVFACSPTHLTTDRILVADLFAEGEEEQNLSH